MPSNAIRFYSGLIPENPVYRQLLALCPTLAVTSTVGGAMTMAAATGFVLICANLITSLIRKLLKPHLRILIFTVTIATFVTIADRVLAAFMPAMSDKLGPYIPLIIVNCMIICRCEVCASKQGPVRAVSDALGQSLGFALALLSISVVREVLSTGSILTGLVGPDGAGIGILPDGFPVWNLMALPPGAFFTLGILLGVANWIGSMKKTKTA